MHQWTRTTSTSHMHHLTMHHACKLHTIAVHMHWAVASLAPSSDERRQQWMYVLCALSACKEACRTLTAPDAKLWLTSHGRSRTEGCGLVRLKTLCVMQAGVTSPLACADCTLLQLFLPARVSAGLAP